MHSWEAYVEDIRRTTGRLQLQLIQDLRREIRQGEFDMSGAVPSDTGAHGKPGSTDKGKGGNIDKHGKYGKHHGGNKSGGKAGGKGGGGKK